MLPGLSSMLIEAVVGASGSLVVTITPSSISKTLTTRAGSKTVTTSSVTASASGGTVSYAYAWSRVSGDAAITAATPSAASTTFSATVAADETKIAVFACTATDAAGFTAVKQITVTLELIFVDVGGTL